MDQSGQLGGAEQCLLSIVQGCTASVLGGSHLVGLFADGSFRIALEAHHLPVQILTDRLISVRRGSGLLQGLRGFLQLLPLISRTCHLSRQYDLIYANTQKALVVGSIASWFSHRPLVYHLHDILSLEHFSVLNQRLAVWLANRSALVIANSHASRAAFIAAGGHSTQIAVVHNGFDSDRYLDVEPPTLERLRAKLQLVGQFVVGHFSRFSPWKGQHILLEALHHCPEPVSVLFVGDALFGEQAYVQQIQAQAIQLGLRDRVRFLGFCPNVVPLMHLCDVITHTSTAAEPFGRVVVEAMLCGKPTIATAAGGVLEIVESGVNGWLVPPGQPELLAQAINHCRQNPQQAQAIGQFAQKQARQRFQETQINQQLIELLVSTIAQARSFS